MSDKELEIRDKEQSIYIDIRKRFYKNPFSRKSDRKWVICLASDNCEVWFNLSMQDVEEIREYLTAILESER